MNRSRIVTAATLAATLLVGSVFASPYWELHRLRSAVQDRDADAVSEHVDFPSLRENIKGQLSAMMLAEMKKPEAAANPFAAMGQALAMAVLNPMVDAMVSPAGVIAMMENGKARLPEKGEPAHSGGPERKVDYAISYRSWDRVAVEVKSGDGGSFIFKRHGLWSWKLSAIALPETMGGSKG